MDFLSILGSCSIISLLLAFVLFKIDDLLEFDLSLFYSLFFIVGLIAFVIVLFFSLVFPMESQEEIICTCCECCKK